MARRSTEIGNGWVTGKKGGKRDWVAVESRGKWYRKKWERWDVGGSEWKREWRSEQ